MTRVRFCQLLTARFQCFNDPTSNQFANKFCYNDVYQADLLIPNFRYSVDVVCLDSTSIQRDLLVNFQKVLHWSRGLSMNLTALS